MKIILLVFTCWALAGCASSLLSSPTHSQNQTASSSDKDSEMSSATEPDRWTADDPSVLNAKLGVIQPGLQMHAKPIEGPGDVDFLPMSTSKAFVGFGYRNLGFFLSTAMKRSPEEQEKYGSGESTDFLLQFFGRKWTQQYFYQSYSGYYISNSGSIDSSLPKDRHIQRPDIKTAHYGANFLYNHNPERFSPAVAFNQSGRQQKSGGAWLSSVSLHNHRFSGQPQVLPAQVAPKFKELETLQQGDLIQLSVAGGGGYTYIFSENLFMSGQLLVGIGGVYQKFETANIVYTQTAVSTYINTTVSFGYNGKQDYLVLAAMQDAVSYPLPDMSLQLTALQGGILYGRRFGGVDLAWLDRVSALLD